MAIKEDTKAPAFTLPDQDGTSVSLAEYAGKWLVLYFYPKDNTPGCTTESLEFSLYLKNFEALGAAVAGISADSVKSHLGFMEKHKLKVRLLSDESKTTLKEYGVWQLKKMAGREYMGIVRTTLIIGPDGIVKKVWPKVSVMGHVEEVLGSLKELRNS